MNKFAIKLTNISKKYILHHEKPTMVENILKKSKREEFWALRDINLEIKKGERVGIIGPNGSGKTTLLEIIAKITTPTHGEVYTQGKLVSLIELEAGFHPELTGEENIFLNGLLVGMSKEDVRKKLRRIISFADIGNFIDAPFYTYSEGMKLRLSLAIIIHTSPDILIFDEVLSVGDQNFQKKSFGKIEELIKGGKTMLTVSQNLDFLSKSCNRIVWFSKGRIKKEGSKAEVISEYKKIMKI